jgi:hypothetical protein
MILIFKPETNSFVEAQNALLSQIEEHAIIKHKIYTYLSPAVLVELYGNGFSKFPNSYSQKEILWIHNQRWGPSTLIWIHSPLSVNVFRNQMIGGIHFEEGTLRKYWQSMRDNSQNSLEFWRARGLQHIPRASSETEIPSTPMSPERLYLLLNGIHCPKDDTEMEHDNSILAPLFRSP